MSITTPAAELDAFRDVILLRLGLQIEETRLPELAQLLAERLRETGCQSARGYLDLLAAGAGGGRDELRAVAERVTVGETYFFRNPQQFQAFAEIVLPALLESGGEEIRLLSAGAASGDEAYSLAILLDEKRQALAGRKVSIQAIDVNRRSLRRAVEARYSQWSVRQMPPGVLARFFQETGKLFALEPRIRSLVSFEERNLVEEDSLLWSPGAFDVIFCRNVLMYFSPDAARAVVGRLARSLKPGGYLFLGHAETLRGLSTEFELLHSHDTFYYQKRRSPAPASSAGSRQAISDPPAMDDSASSGVAAGAWFERIQSATERIRSLAHATARSTGGDLGLRRPAPSGETEREPEMLLLYALDLANEGRLSAAEEVLRATLEIDELDPAAHYLLAFCLEQSGELAAALEHYRCAIYLDASFAMPRLRLGRLAVRQGDPATGRRQLLLALESLHREDAARILLFGGGFCRAGLLDLCRAELRALGERTG